MKKLIDLPDLAAKELKKEAKELGRSFKKHIEMLLEKHAETLVKSKSKK